MFSHVHRSHFYPLNHLPTFGKLYFDIYPEEGSTVGEFADLPVGTPLVVPKVNSKDMHTVRVPPPI